MEEEKGTSAETATLISSNKEGEERESEGDVTAD